MATDELSLPKSTESEEALLGCVLVNEYCLVEVQGVIKPEDFYSKRNQWIWEAFQTLKAGGTPIDIITVHEELTRLGYAEVDSSYVTSLVAQVTSTLNAVAYAEIIEGMSVRRKMINRANELAKIALNENLTLDETLEQYDKFLSDKQISGTSKQSDTQDADEASLELLNDIMANDATGIKLGWPEFDNVEYGLGGLPKNGVSILVGDSSYGKSAWTEQLCEQVALMGGTALYFGYEQPNKAMVSRRVFGNTGVNYKKLRSGSLTEQEQAILSNEITNNYQGRFSASGGRLLMNSKARSLAKIKKEIAQNKPSGSRPYIVVIDQFKFITDRTNANNITISFNENLTALKEIANLYDCHILVVHGITPEESSKFFEANQKAMNKLDNTNRMPDINNISWAKDMKYITDVFLFLIPDVNTQIVQVSNKNATTVYKMIIWILKDREGDRFKSTYWEYDLLKQWWTDIPSPNKTQSKGQKPSSYVPEKKKTMFQAPDEYKFNDVSEEIDNDDD